MSSRNRHRKRQYSENIETAMKSIAEAFETTAQKLTMKRDVLSESLKALGQIAENAGLKDLKFEFAEGGEMFLESSLSDYLDGSQFTAFESSDDEYEYSAVMGVSLEEDGEHEDEFSISAEMTLIRSKIDGSLHEAFYDGSWMLLAPGFEIDED